MVETTDGLRTVQFRIPEPVSTPMSENNAAQQVPSHDARKPFVAPSVADLGGLAGLTLLSTGP